MNWIGICRFSKAGLALAREQKSPPYLPWRGQVTGPLAAGFGMAGNAKTSH